PAERQAYADTFFEPDPAVRQTLADLKRSLRDRFGGAGRVAAYAGVWDPAAVNPEDDKLTGRLTRLDALGDRVEADLKRAIAEEFGEHLAALGRRDPLAEERSFHEAFVEHRTQAHVPRSAVEDEITNYVEGDDPRPLVLSGPPGAGKSAVLAHWARRHAGPGV